MEATTAGRYRVVDAPAPDDGRGGSTGTGFVLAALPGDGGDATDDADGGSAGDDAGAYEPVTVAAGGYEGDLADAVGELRPGYVVRATIEWDGGDARFASVDVERRTRYLFADGVTDLFEAARDAWQEARAAGDAMASRVTRDTDGDPNGALYVFADGGGGGGGSPVRRAATAGRSAGGSDLFDAFRDGTTPLDPLVERVNEDAADGPREVFVLRPADGAFVVVYIAFEKGGLLARTVRDTYF